MCRDGSLRWLYSRNSVDSQSPVSFRNPILPSYSREMAKVWAILAIALFLGALASGESESQFDHNQSKLQPNSDTKV